MHPTLFTIGKWAVPTYTVLLDLGLILGLLLTYFEGKRRFADGALALDLGLWTVIGGIIGGRIGFVLANWSVFSEDWLRVFRIWEGGLSFHGALLGGLLVMLIFSLLRRKDQEPVSFWDLGDVVTPGLALGIAFGWAACLMGGCAFGALGEGFGYAVLPDIYGVEASRFATQIFGLGFSFVLLIGIWLLRGYWPFAGASFLMYLLLYFTGQFFLEFTRGDEAIFLGPWRLAQALDLALALAAAAGLILLWRQASQEPVEEDETGNTQAPVEERSQEMEQEGPAEPDKDVEAQEVEGENPVGASPEGDPL